MFDQSAIVSVAPPVVVGREYFLSWTSTAPAGTWYQVYLNGVLGWCGTATRCYVPMPAAASSPIRVDIGTVLPSESTADLSGTLPAPPNRRVVLSWQGGTFEAPDLAGFRVYGATAPGGPVAYGTPLDDVAAHPSGIATDGFGLGGFGGGGFGRAAGTYGWTSPALRSGTWTFAVVPYDAAGNEGTPQTCTATIAAPPLEPAVFPGTNARLRYTLLGFGQFGFGVGGYGEPEAVLTWQPSPG